MPARLWPHWQNVANNTEKQVILPREGRWNSLWDYFSHVLTSHWYDIMPNMQELKKLCFFLLLLVLCVVSCEPLIFNLMTAFNVNYHFMSVPSLNKIYGIGSTSFLHPDSRPASYVKSDSKLENVWEETTKLHKHLNWWSGCGLWGELFIQEKCLFSHGVGQSSSDISML